MAGMVAVLAAMVAVVTMEVMALSLWEVFVAVIGVSIFSSGSSPAVVALSVEVLLGGINSGIVGGVVGVEISVCHCRGKRGNACQILGVSVLPARDLLRLPSKT